MRQSRIGMYLHYHSRKLIYTNASTKHNPNSLLRLEGCLERPLSLGRNASQMPPLTALPIYQGRVLRHTVVPDNNGALLPLHAGLEISAVGEMVVQELEQSIGLLLLEADNVTCNCISCQLWGRIRARR